MKWLSPLAIGLVLVAASMPVTATIAVAQALAPDQNDEPEPFAEERVRITAFRGDVLLWQHDFDIAGDGSAPVYQESEPNAFAHLIGDCPTSPGRSGSPVRPVELIDDTLEITVRKHRREGENDDQPALIEAITTSLWREPVDRSNPELSCSAAGWRNIRSRVHGQVRPDVHESHVIDGPVFNITVTRP